MSHYTHSQNLIVTSWAGPRLAFSIILHVCGVCPFAHPCLQINRGPQMFEQRETLRQILTLGDEQPGIGNPTRKLFTFRTRPKEDSGMPWQWPYPRQSRRHLTRMRRIKQHIRSNKPFPGQPIIQPSTIDEFSTTHIPVRPYRSHHRSFPERHIQAAHIDTADPSRDTLTTRPATARHTEGKRRGLCDGPRDRCAILAPRN